MMTPPPSCAAISSPACHDPSIVPRRSTGVRRSRFALLGSVAPSPGGVSAPAVLVPTAARPGAARAPRPVTAAIGDASDAIATGRAAKESAAAGARFVKVGFAGIGSATTIADIVAAAVFGSRAASVEKTGVVAVAYADAARVATVPFD